MARQRGFPIRTRSPRRATAWGFGPDAVSVALSASAKTGWTNGIVLASEAKATIVRIRGDLLLTLLTADGANGGFAGAVGIGIATSNAFSAGIASLPGPITDADWPGWMWHHFINVRATTATIADGVNAGAATQRIVIDSKAMRKWDFDMTIFGAVEVVESGVSTANLAADSRMLVKLS